MTTFDEWWASNALIYDCPKEHAQTIWDAARTTLFPVPKREWDELTLRNYPFLDGQSPPPLAEERLDALKALAEKWKTGALDGNCPQFFKAGLLVCAEELEEALK